MSDKVLLILFAWFLSGATLTYGYDTRGQLLAEPYQLTSSDQETEQSRFDTSTATDDGTLGTATSSGNNEGGLGVVGKGEVGKGGRKRGQVGR